MKKQLYILLLICTLLMTGCKADEKPETIQTQEAVSSEIQETEELQSSSATSASTTTTVRTTVTTTSSTTQTTTTTATTAETTTTTADENQISPDSIIPPAVQTPRVDGNRLTFNITNIYSQGEYYTLEISGVKMYDSSDISLGTTYVKGELYGDFRLDLIKNGEIIDTLKINIPRQDRFLILESVIDNLSYGCEIISNHRTYSADEYPDIIQLDFYMEEDPEIPQYARYFAIFGGKLAELPIYENGAEAAPLGTHLEMVKAGVMSQYIVSARFTGYYAVMQYEYIFDVNNRLLIKNVVKLHR